MDGFYKLCGMVWGGFLRFCSTFAWPLGIGGGIALGALLVVMYWGGAFTPKRTIEQMRVETVDDLSKEEREYLAVAIIRDAMVESEPERVQEGVAWSVVNFRKKYGVDIPTIVKNSLTMVPLNYEGGRPLIPTIKFYVLYREANAGQRKAALALADKIVTKGSAALSDQALICSTQYIRKPRSTHTPPEDVIKRFENPGEFKEVPKGTSANPGAGRFFCPMK